MEKNNLLIKDINKNVRTSPRKLALVCNFIKGKKADIALRDLEFSRKRIAKDVSKTVKSAISNAENNYQFDIDNLFVKIDERLHEIIKRFYPKALFFNGSSNSPKDIINSQIPICDLGSLFINNINDVKKNHIKYLISEPKLTNQLKKTITNKKKLVCGLSWISKNDDIGSSKSITLEMLKPILALEDIIFLDLQYSDTKDERINFFNDNGIEIKKFDKIDNFKDLNGVTSLIDACDFIITVSNTNAHMAGALGKKTFLLLPKGKGRLWYWSSLKNKSIWYPSIEIIEQNFPGEWRSVIDNLRKKVESFTNG